MIASLYRGGKFIEPFLRNITAQTLFDKSELIIVDAASPDGEHELIADYQKPCIRISSTSGSTIASGSTTLGTWACNCPVVAYLTNTNLDDLRRDDSIALQADLLDREADLDVVYQDFFYSFDSDLDFDEVAAFGYKSELPIITPHNLLAFNSPHNAPMWRKSLHDDLGLFDTSYRSAGDYEFWLRCMASGKRFGKINTPHVVYFQNPEGISTRPDTRGLEESYRILSRYSEQVTSRRCCCSRGATFMRKPRDRPCARCSRRAPTSLRRDPGRVAAMRQQSFRRAPDRRHRRQRRHARSRQTMRLLVDGVFFQLAQTGIGRVWVTLLSKLARVPDLEIILLDRGRCPEIDGVARVPFPAYTMTYTAADSLLIQKVCDDLAIDVFSSTYYTSPLTTPQVQMVYDMIPEVMEFDLSARAWKEKQLALSYASHFACISANTRHDLLHFYPGIAPERAVVTHCGVDAAVFNPPR